MYKNQLQELAQRSCFNLPSYACIRQGLDHAPRFKASVNFNGEIFESPNYCPTLRQAEHAAAEVALNVLSTRGPSRSLTARVLVMPKLGSLTTKQDNHEEQANVTEVLSSFRPKDDGKQVRRRDPNPPPKKIFRGHHRDNNIGSSSSLPSSSNISSQDEKLKLMEMIMELSQEDSILKYNTFTSLLPPPPPRTVSKILPPSIRPIPVQVRSRLSPHLIQTSLEDHHKKDEEQWLGKKPSVIVKPCHYPLSSNLNAYTTTTSPSSSGIKSSHLSRTMFSDQSHPHKIAPAVQIRSVIPVCAAAPVTHSATTKPRAEEVSSSSSVTTTTTTTTSKFNKPQFSMLGSDFKKLQL
ncbi:hypothetical protein CsatA_017208 [Cannabis sativa]